MHCLSQNVFFQVNGIWVGTKTLTGIRSTGPWVMGSTPSTGFPSRWLTGSRWKCLSGLIRDGCRVKRYNVWFSSYDSASKGRIGKVRIG